MNGEHAPAAPKRAASPWDLRLMAVLCTLLSAMVGFGASAGAMEVLSPPSPSEQSLSIGNALASEAYLHAMEVERQALEPMRGPRALILFALSVCAGVTLIGGIRLVRPSGLPREGVRRLTAGAALIAAVLRTLDGAQELAVAKRTAQALGEFVVKLLELNVSAEWQLALQRAFVAGMVMKTIVFAGAFAALWTYLSTQRVRNVVGDDG